MLQRVEHTSATSPLTALLDASVTAYGALPALNFLGRRWTYAQLGRQVDEAAAGLQRLGVTKGSKVGLCLPNTPYSVIFYFAVLKAGGTVVNFSPLYVERELKHQIRDSGTTIMVVPDLKIIHSRVAAVAQEAGLSTIVVCPFAAILSPLKGLLFNIFKRKDKAVFDANDGRHLTHKALVAGAPPLKPVSVDPERDVAVLQYTGGTTGVPKGAMLSHANVAANARQVIDHVNCLGTGCERILGVLPLFHVFAMTTVMNIPIALGAEIILVPRFHLDDLLKTIVRTRPTVFPGVPTIYGAINNAPDLASYDLSSLSICISGGAPLPVEVRHRFEALAGCKLVEGYGLSETAPVLTANPPNGIIKDGSVGLAVPGTTLEIRDLEDPARVLGVGQKGEVCARGPQVMLGYWQKPEETARVFVDGAFRTGDVGYLDEDGYLFLVDRIKDVILCGGFNVYPRMIEEALYLHPAVAEAVVIGVPDSYRGQAPKAFVTLKVGHPATVAELKSFLTKQVSKVELPREVEIRDQLPRTLVGKLSKKELVDEEARKHPQA
ncbi:long-chain-fatty-acid--CoA ligase [Azorhizobium doebereinerae]|uniref:long-chain-fatty-acid--CoA ligase n=1 Tax=Azorhizobium doebereinerae TaxID=281091 RepID=UPI0004180BA2|nr:long-chain fatty acid--CoA ligase [Azorhizobium doebereinerae]